MSIENEPRIDSKIINPNDVPGISSESHIINVDDTPDQNITDAGPKNTEEWHPSLFTTTTSIENRKIPRKLQIAMITAGGLVALSLATGVGVAIGNSGRPTPIAEAPIDPTTEPTVESTTEPTIEPSPEPTVEPESPESLLSDVEISEPTVSFEEMERMSIEEFLNQSYVDRAAYIYERVFDNGLSRYVAVINEEFNPEVVPGAYHQTLRQDSISESTPTEGAKIASGLFYYTTDLQTGEISDAFKLTIAGIQAFGGEGVGILDTKAYVDNGSTQTIEDRHGNSVVSTNITYQMLDRQTGDLLGTERTEQVFHIPIKLRDGRTIVAYPAGYSIDGKQSPIEGYPY